MEPTGACQPDSACPAEPQLCSNGCGFYANPPRTLCSKCFKEAEAKQGPPFGSGAPPTKGKETMVASVGPPQKVVGSPPPPVLVPEQPEQPEQPKAEQASSSAPAPPPAAAAAVAAAAAAAEQPPPRKAQTPGRCFFCSKKTGLTGFRCRCDRSFCATHRLAEAHECPFDYKAMERERLAKNNPLVQASKLDKF